MIYFIHNEALGAVKIGSTLGRKTHATENAAIRAVFSHLDPPIVGHRRLDQWR